MMEAGDGGDCEGGTRAASSSMEERGGEGSAFDDERRWKRAVQVGSVDAQAVPDGRDRRRTPCRSDATAPGRAQPPRAAWAELNDTEGAMEV